MFVCQNETNSIYCTNYGIYHERRGKHEWWRVFGRVFFLGVVIFFFGGGGGDFLQYSTVQYSTVQCSTVQFSTVQYNIVQYSTVQYSTVQYSTQYSTHGQVIFASKSWRCEEGGEEEEEKSI